MSANRLTACPEWRRELKRQEVVRDVNRYAPQAVRFEPRDLSPAPVVERCPFVTHWRGARPASVCGLPVARGHYCATHAEVMYADVQPYTPKRQRGDAPPHLRRRQA